MEPNPTLDRIRYLAAGGAVLVAVLYLLIAIDVVTVVDEQAAADATPLYVAAALFALLAVGVASMRSRAMYAAGAALQLLVIVGYLVIAADRIPSFEAWGIAIKIIQVGLLTTFIYLMVRREQDPVGRVEAEPRVVERPPSAKR
jgi:hypothetical protein